jgi:cytidylate kinase
MRDTLDERARLRRLKIAIDGPAGAGKSTIGHGLAESLHCAYLDTGIMYRAVTLAALRAGTPMDNADRLAEIAARLTFAWSHKTPVDMLVEGREPDPELRSPRVDANVSQVSAHPAVRSVLVDRQRSLANSRCVVMVGRDIGTVVLPDAPVKLWITASPEERVRRREAEMAASGPSPAEVAGRMQIRDQIDSGRSASPAVPAADAIIVCTDGQSPSDSIREALALIETAMEQVPASAT